jgi:hypothetical protein
MRIKHTGRRKSQRGAARMSLVDHGLYIHYYPSDGAMAIIRQWSHRVSLELEVDDETGAPLILYLVPATVGGLVVKEGGTGAPYIGVRSDQWTLEDGPLQVVEETVAESEIKVRIPFKLRRVDQAA